VLDQLCYDRDRAGPRDPTSRRNASGVILQPRATLLAGPFADVSFMAAVGRGARAADPSYLGDNDAAPFSTITAAEGGVVWDHQAGEFAYNLRSVYYYTHVDRDLIFNQQEGRSTLAPGTHRQGVLLAGRARGPFFDVSASATYARARFDAHDSSQSADYVSADAGNRVPFIPDWVARLDGALFKRFDGSCSARARASASAAVSRTSRRARSSSGKKARHWCCSTARSRSASARSIWA
jgi:hypothetical protein